MPCTAIRITQEDGSVVRLKFLTVWNPPVTDVDLYQCNDQFIPMGEPGMTTSDLDEETYHKNLRKDASDKNQFVPEESTDPQWNSGYVEPPDEDEPTV